MFNVTVYFIFRSFSVFVNDTAIVSMKNHFIFNYCEIMVLFSQTYENKYVTVYLIHDAGIDIVYYFQAKQSFKFNFLPMDQMHTFFITY
jgi:hypothetical protein